MLDLGTHEMLAARARGLLPVLPHADRGQVLLVPAAGRRRPPPARRRRRVVRHLESVSAFDVAAPDVGVTASFVASFLRDFSSVRASLESVSRTVADLPARHRVLDAARQRDDPLGLLAELELRRRLQRQLPLARRAARARERDGDARSRDLQLRRRTFATPASGDDRRRRRRPSPPGATVRHRRRRRLRIVTAGSMYARRERIERVRARSA